MNNIRINVDMSGEQKGFKRFFNAVGYANVDYTYTEPTKKMYDYLSSFHNHFTYMRLHNILTAHGKGDYYHQNHGMDYGNPKGHGNEEGEEAFDSVVTLDEQGNLKYDWTTVDKVYDIMMEHGIRPIVETVYMPSCIQKSPELWFMPKDYNLWKQVLTEFVTHLQQRYGKEEVEKWYFEVWNEPDNHKPWVEDPELFNALYDYMEDAIHSVNPRFKVGGPAVKQGEGAMKIFKAFLSHCVKGLNTATGKFGTRVDFIAVHCKGGWPNAYNPSTEVMFDSLKKYMDVLKEYPELKGVEFFNDESDIVWMGNMGTWYESWLNFRNTHYFPGFVCKMVNTYCNVAEDEYGVNLSIVDSDNCHLQWERYLYSGNRSQFTSLIKYPSTDLIKKSSFNAYVLLSRLGDTRFNAVCREEGFGRKFGILPTVVNNTLSIMVWNFEDGMDDDINHRDIEVSISNIPFRGKYKLTHYRIDKDHSNSYGVWSQLGKPENPKTDEIMKIREREGLELYSPVETLDMKDEMSFHLNMPMHSVSLLLLTPENSDKPQRTSFIKGIAENGYNGNRQVFLKWKPNEEKDFLYYKVMRRKQEDGEFKVISDNTSVNTGTFIDMDVEAGYKYYYKVISVNASMVESDRSDDIEVCVMN